MYAKFDEKGQWSSQICGGTFITASTWTEFIIPGLTATLKAAALGAVFALVFGAVFGLARLSDHRLDPTAGRCGGRHLPLDSAAPADLLHVRTCRPRSSASGDYTLLALVGGLTLYNGSVLAEVRPRRCAGRAQGQSEAAYALGLRKAGVMWLVLLPQAVTAMMPAIVSQLVVLLKDTALGYIIGYQDLLSYGFQILPANYFGTRVSSAIVIAAIYIGLNMTLSALAGWLEQRPFARRDTAAARAVSRRNKPAVIPVMSPEVETCGERLNRPLWALVLIAAAAGLASAQQMLIDFRFGHDS